MRFLLAGDAIYSAKHLASFMKDAFAEDLLRENEKMERFAAVERPEQVEASGVTAAPRAAPPAPAAPPRRNTLQPSAALAALSGGGASPAKRSPGAMSPGNGAVAVGVQSARIDIPPPSEEELAEMDGTKDRTVIVDNSTAIGLSPFAASAPALDTTAPASKQLRPSSAAAPSSGNSTTQDNLPPAPPPRKVSAPAADETLVPQPRSSLIEDTGSHDLRPIEMTGFRPALDHHEDDEAASEPPLDATMPPRPSGRAKIVIGDAPVGGATSIGPSPYANGTGNFDPEALDPEDEDSQGEQTGEDAGASYDEEAAEDPAASYDEAAQSYDEEPAQDEEDAPEPTSEKPAIAPRAVRQPARQKARAAAPPADGKRKGLLIAIAVTAVLAVVVVAGAVIKMTGHPKSSVFVSASPKSVKYTLTVNPGQLTYDTPASPIELEPGEYTFEFKPRDEGYLSAKKVVSLKAGKTAAQPVSVLFARSTAEPEPTPTPEPTPEPVKPAAEAPKLWSLRIDSSEPSAEVLLDGKARGMAPVTLSDLAMGTSYEVTVRKSGFASQTFTVGNDAKAATVERKITLLREKAPEPVATKDPEPAPKKETPAPQPKKDPEPVAKKETPAPQPKKDPEPVAKKETPAPQPKKDPEPAPKKDPAPAPKAKGTGKAAFASVPIGADVYVDGKKVGTTPINQAHAVPLSFGKHKAVFKLDGKTSSPVEFDITDQDVDKAQVVRGKI